MQLRARFSTTLHEHELMLQQHICILLRSPKSCARSKHMSVCWPDGLIVQLIFLRRHIKRYVWLSTHMSIVTQQLPSRWQVHISPSWPDSTTRATKSGQTCASSKPFSDAVLLLWHMHCSCQLHKASQSPPMCRLLTLLKLLAFNRYFSNNR